MALTGFEPRISGVWWRERSANDAPQPRPRRRRRRRRSIYIWMFAKIILFLRHPSFRENTERQIVYIIDDDDEMLVMKRLCGIFQGKFISTSKRT